MKYLTLFLIALALQSCASTSERGSSKSERAERADEIFKSFDTNGDGYLTKQELSGGMRMAGMPDMNPNLMLGLKSEGKKNKKSVKASRKLSEAEIQRAMQDAFDRRDAELDQRLSQDEFRTLVVERAAEPGEDPWAPFM